jgi:hypothetical protein
VLLLVLAFEGNRAEIAEGRVVRLWHLMSIPSEGHARVAFTFVSDPRAHAASILSFTNGTLSRKA